MAFNSVAKALSSVTIFQICAYVSLQIVFASSPIPRPGLHFEIWCLSVRKVLFPYCFRYSSMTRNTNVIIAQNDSKQLQGWEDTQQQNTPSKTSKTMMHFRVLMMMKYLMLKVSKYCSLKHVLTFQRINATERRSIQLLQATTRMRY